MTTIGPTQLSMWTSEALAATTCPESTYFSAASPVKTSARPDGERALQKAHALVFGSSSDVLLANFDRALCCWKTSQQSLAMVEQSLLPTLPKWGMTAAGGLYRRPTPERRTNGNAGSAWPTPAAQEAGWKHIDVVDKDGNPPAYLNQRFYDKHTGRLVQKGLQQAVTMWPTPTLHSASERLTRYQQGGTPLTLAVKQWPTPQTRDFRSGSRSESPRMQRKQNAGWSPNLNDQVLWASPTASMMTDGDLHQAKFRSTTRPKYDTVNTGSLNPDWVEQCLMGFPAGWSDLSGPPVPANPNTTTNPRARYKVCRIVSTASRRSAMRSFRPWSTR